MDRGKGSGKLDVAISLKVRQRLDQMAREKKRGAGGREWRRKGKKMI